MSSRLKVIFLALLIGTLLAGFGSGYAISNYSTPHEISTTTLTATITTQLPNLTSTITTGSLSVFTETATEVRSVTSTSTTPYQFLTMQQAINASEDEGMYPYVEMAGLGSSNYTFSVASGEGNNFVFRLDLNGSSGVQAGLVSLGNSTLFLTLRNYNSSDETFVFYADNSTSLLVIYLFWYGISPP